MRRTSHTHQGHCQACARVQAVDNNSGLLAKHGYKVAGFGFFNGVCHGASRLPLEIERTYCDEILVRIAKYATDMETYVKALESGSAHPHRCTTGKTIAVRVLHNRTIWEDETVLWEDADKYQREHAVERAIWRSNMEARTARNHHKELTRIAKEVHGKPLRKVERKAAPLKIEVGMSFTHNNQTWTVRSLVNRGWRRAANPNYAVCEAQGERPWTTSFRTIRNLVGK